MGVAQDGQIKPSLMSIGELIDNILAAAFPLRTSDGNEIVFADELPCRYYAFAFDPVTKKSAWRPITSFHSSPGPGYTLPLANGVRSYRDRNRRS